MKTKLLIEQHFHGAFGIDFNTASSDDILYLSKEILKYGIGGIFPTIVTDSVENTKRAIANIKTAASKQTHDMAKILGIHLEGIFLNPEKKGIHNPEHFLKPTVENYKLIEDDFIKIVTLAPELAAQSPLPLGEGKILNELASSKNSGEGLIDYLRQKGVKVQAGHCTGGDLTGCTGVTHLFNAMTGVTHRGKSTALSALINDDIYTEIIADGVHVSDEALKLVFKTKPVDKIILISDCLPCTKLSLRGVNKMNDVVISSNNEITTQTAFARDDMFEFTFADEKVYYDGIKATSKEGTLAGSTALLPDIIKCLAQKNVIASKREAIQPIIKNLINNPYKYHNIDLDGFAEWDEEWNIINYEK